jgi:hypothetical protein
VLVRARALHGDARHGLPDHDAPRARAPRGTLVRARWREAAHGDLTRVCFALGRLGLNTVAFALAGALVPLVTVLTARLASQLALLAAAAGLGAAALAAAPHPEAPALAARLPPRVRPRGGGGGPCYAEAAFAGAVFWLIGGKVAMTSYVATYVRAAAATSGPRGTGATAALLLLWAAIAAGRLLGLRDQVALQRQVRASEENQPTEETPPRKNPHPNQKSAQRSPASCAKQDLHLLAPVPGHRGRRRPPRRLARARAPRHGAHRRGGALARWAY